MAPRADANSMIFSGASSDEASGIDALYRRYSQSIRNHIERHFGLGPPDPEDAVQAAFERFARIQDKSDIADPAAFLRRSARNFVLDHHRAQQVRSAHARAERALEGDASDDFDAERVLSSKERLEIIDRAIRAMDEKRREVLIMNRIHGLSYAEIARRLSCSQTLVKMRVAEAVILCQRALRAAEGEP